MTLQRHFFGILASPAVPLILLITGLILIQRSYAAPRGGGHKRSLAPLLGLDDAHWESGPATSKSP